MYSSTPWTRCLLMAGQTYRDKQPFPLHNLKLPIHLSLHTEKPCPPGDSIPDPFFAVRMLTTAPLKYCFQKHFSSKLKYCFKGLACY